MAYDRQLIVVVHPAKAERRQTLIDGARALKAAKSIENAVVLDPTAESVGLATRRKFAALTAQSRLYLSCHGGTSLAGVQPEAMAAFLKLKCGLQAAGKIVVIACGSSVAMETVQKFHAALGNVYGIFTDVFGYLYPIKVIDHGDMELVAKLAEIGLRTLDFKLGERRLRLDDGTSLEARVRPRHVPVSKYVFAWVAGVQVFETVY